MAKPPKVKVRPTHTVSTPALQTIDFGKVEYDPRFDPRVKEQERIANTTADIEKRMNVNAPTLSLVDLEGQPFVTSMSDRTAAGANLIGLEGVPFKRPVELRGGQGYMFENPGQVWASGEKPVYDIMTAAKIMKEVTGKDPLYLPWRMSPTGSDFASMAGETMLNYAESAMGRKAKQALDKQIKQFIPDWRGVDSPESIDQFRAAPDTIRKALKNMMDVKFRDEGGINIGQARLAVSDPAQLNAPQMDIMNIGRIFADKPIIQESGHPWYPRGVPGEGVGVIDQPRNILELLPEVVKERGIPDPKNPRHEDRRSMELNVRSGIIDDKLLKALGLAEGGLVNDTLEGMVKAPKAAEMLDLDLARLALANRMSAGGQPRQPSYLETKNIPFEQFRNSIGMNDGGDAQPMAGGGKVRIMHGSPVKITPTNERPLHVTTDPLYATKRGSDKLGQFGLEGPPMVNRYDIPEERLLRMDETPYTAEQVNQMRRYWNRLPADTGMTGEEIYDLLSANKQPIDRLMPGITEAGGFWGYQRPATGTGGRDEWFKITKPENLEVVKKKGGVVHPSPEEMLIEMMERGYAKT